MFQEEKETIDFDYCLICSGCNFGPFHKWGESLWFPTVHGQARLEGSWPQFDERFIEGRRRHILDEWKKINVLNQKSASILVTGAGFIGVEWATELRHFFPNLKLSIIDMAPNCLGPLPLDAKGYCVKYMDKVGINQVYGIKYAPEEKEFWDKLKLPFKGVEKTYVCIGVKASNYFMPKETLSDKGPGGGGWILMGMKLEVTTKDGKTWAEDKGYPTVYAVGDCNFGCVETAGKPPDEWAIPPIPKISYPGEEEAIIACANIHRTEKLLAGKTDFMCAQGPIALADMHWPWGAGMFATSLGPQDACFVAGANWKKNSGLMCLWGSASAVQKEIIEASKTDECAYGLVGRLIWHFVHHTPIHLWGKAPLMGY